MIKKTNSKINKNESSNSVFVVIPAYNEEKVIADVVKRVKKLQYHVLVVNDKSKDNTAEVARKAGAIVVSHKVNQGAGAATRTGLKEALKRGAKYIVTIDADGQHDPKDIPKVMKRAHLFDVVIGSRMIKPKGMPIHRKFFNFGGSVFTWMLFGIFVRDSQTGFKIFSKKAAQQISITENRYEFCSEILWEIHKHKLTHIEVPIKVIYTEYSLNKGHGQSFFTGIKMLKRMINLRFKKK